MKVPASHVVLSGVLSDLEVLRVWAEPSDARPPPSAGSGANTTGAADSGQLPQVVERRVIVSCALARTGHAMKRAGCLMLGLRPVRPTSETTPA